MTPAREELLMRYLDGEVTDAEAAEVEALLESSAEARGLVDDLAQVGELVRSVAEERGSAAAGVADAVMASIAGAPSPRSHLRVVAGGGGEDVPAPHGPTRRRIGAVIPVGGLLLAAAAAVALLVRSPALPPAPVGGAALAPGSALASAAAQDPSSVAVGEPETGASIESVDFGAQEGSIFMVPSGPDVTPVVWLLDEAAPSGDRMAPL